MFRVLNNMNKDTSEMPANTISMRDDDRPTNSTTQQKHNPTHTRMSLLLAPVSSTRELRENNNTH
jgi:hypothetical protein